MEQEKYLMTNDLQIYDLNLKTITVVISSIQLILTIIGLIWAYFRFRIENPHHPRIELDLDCKFFTLQGKSILTAITVTAHNKGNIEHKFREIKIRILGIKNGADFGIHAPTKSPPITKFTEDLCLTEVEGSRVKEIDLLRKELNPENPDGEYYFVRPNVSQNFSHVIHIPSDIRFVIIRAKFTYDDKKIKENHTAERVFEVISETKQ